MFDRATSSDIDRRDAASARDRRRLLEAIRRFLPLVAHPKGRPRALAAHAARDRGSDKKCKTTNVFDAGDTFGLMCQIEVGESDPSWLVTPLAELSFDRTHPIARAVADYRRRRAQSG